MTYLQQKGNKIKKNKIKKIIIICRKMQKIPVFFRINRKTIN